LFTELWLGGYVTPSLQSRFPTQGLPRVCTTWEARGW